MPPYILGIHEDSNANATLMHGTEIIASVAEERLNRVKYAAGFPVLSIAECLRIGGITLADVDVIAAANAYHFIPRLLKLLGRSLPTFEHQFLSLAQAAHLSYQQSLHWSRRWRGTIEGFNRWALRRIFGKPVHIVPHHLAHAASAYFTSGFDEALCVTADNFGDGLSGAVYACREGRCELLWFTRARHSPGQYYGELAQLLGHHPLQAGKMTGQAAYGKPESCLPLIRPLLGLSCDRLEYRTPSMLWKLGPASPYHSLRPQDPSDMAAAAQNHFEQIMVDHVRAALMATGLRQVVLAGGVFGNVRVNQLIHELPYVEKTFVHPAMSDSGLSLGACLQYLADTQGLRPFELSNVFYGPRFGEEEMLRAIQAAGLEFRRPENLAGEAARLLAEGKVLARFDGSMEYGPRALGNRSILSQTTDPSVNDWLNKRLKRTEFMPFAPVTLAEFADECYIGHKGAELCTRFMTTSLPCTERMKAQSPGVVHLDGTARPQVLRAQDNPGYHAILKAYWELTGIPSLINTSFNMHSEPIVCTPGDAVRSFLQGHLDVLILGPFLVPNPGEGRGRQG